MNEEQNPDLSYTTEVDSEVYITRHTQTQDVYEQEESGVPNDEYGDGREDDNPLEEENYVDGETSHHGGEQGYGDGESNHQDEDSVTMLQVHDIKTEDCNLPYQIVIAQAQLDQLTAKQQKAIAQAQLHEITSNKPQSKRQ
jgi:hypothetical protein